MISIKEFLTEVRSSRAEEAFRKRLLAAKLKKDAEEAEDAAEEAEGDLEDEDFDINSFNKKENGKELEIDPEDDLYSWNWIKKSKDFMEAKAIIKSLRGSEFSSIFSKDAVVEEPKNRISKIVKKSYSTKPVIKNSWTMTLDSPVIKNKDFEAFETANEVIVDFLREIQPDVFNIKLTYRQSRFLHTSDFKRSDLIDTITNRRYRAVRQNDKSIMRFEKQ